MAVVGGGNTAAEEALFLTNFADRVTLIHRRDSLRADKTNQMRLEANKKIDILYDTEVVDVLGDDNPKGVSAVTLRNTITGTTHDLAVDGLFIAIGHSPATGLFKGQLEMDEAGYIKTAPDSTPYERGGRFRRRRREGQDLPPGGHGRRHGLHGRTRSGAVSRGRARRPELKHHDVINSHEAFIAGRCCASHESMRNGHDRWTGTSFASSTRSPRRAVSRMPGRC